MRIEGQITGWAFDDSEALKLMKISNWGEEFAFGDTTAQFDGCRNLDISAMDVPDLSQTTSLADTFYECQSLTQIQCDGYEWDVLEYKCIQLGSL